METKTRYYNAENVEEYVISVCLHNEEALTDAMNSLVGIRDFKKEANREAFAVLEMRYEGGREIDPVVIVDEWIDLGIFSSAEAKMVASAYEGDTDYRPKIQELAEIGGRRRAKRDIEKLHELAKSNIDTEQLSQKAQDMATGWITGTRRKFKTGAEVEQEVRNEQVGQKLSQGIPLLDDIIYRNAGQHKSTVKATIFREKHGKTRHACWEVAQDLRQGRTVLYITLEGTAGNIIDNIRQVLQDEWDSCKERVLLRDATVNADEIAATIIEAVFTEGLDKVVLDYLHIMEQPNRKYLSENENSNRCCQQLTQLAVKHDFNLHILNQARQSDKNKTGYGNTPKVYDCYGSNQLIKDASIILVGIRPRNYEELLTKQALPPHKPAIQDPDGNTASLNSVFVKPILSRKKLECQHQWLHLIDTDEGLKIHRQQLI